MEEQLQNIDEIIKLFNDDAFLDYLDGINTF